MPAAEPSVVSQGDSNVSRRTNTTTYSLPEDGRAVTINADRRRRRRGEDRDAEDTRSTVSHATNASLLIEYFENGGKGTKGSSGHRPSVRVKVTPSASRKHRFASNGQGVEISEVGSRDGKEERSGSRRPSYTQRALGSPRENGTNEDRLVMGEKRVTRARSYSGEGSTLSSYTSGPEDSNVGHGPLNVTVIREAGSPGSFISSPRDLDPELSTGNAQRRRRNRTARDASFFDGDVKKAKEGRSRSVSRETDISQESGMKAPKLGRRRSRSLSRERISMSREEKEMIERGVRSELEKLSVPRAGRKSGSKSRNVSGSYGNNLKAPRVRSRSRSRSRDRDMDEIALEKAKNHRRKVSQFDSETSPRSPVSPAATHNPHLMEYIQDTIKKMVLPEIEEIKATQKRQASIRLTEAMRSPQGSEITKFSKGPGKPTSMPEGMIIAGQKERDMSEGNSPIASKTRDGTEQTDSHSEFEEGVSLDDPQSPNVRERVRMPKMPFRSDSPATEAGTRMSIRSANSASNLGAPYPQNSGMPETGYTPPPPGGFPELSELNLNMAASALENHSSLLSRETDSGVRSQSQLSKGIAEPSISSFKMESSYGKDYHDDEIHSASSSRPGTASRGVPLPGMSEMSLRSMTTAESTSVARERKARGIKGPEMSDINESDVGDDGDEVVGEGELAARRSSNDAARAFLAAQRQDQQQRALMGGFTGSPHPLSLEVRRVQTETGGREALFAELQQAHQQREQSMASKQAASVPGMDSSSPVQGLPVEWGRNSTPSERSETGRGPGPGQARGSALGQQVFALGAAANPSMRSTPVGVANSIHPSVLDPSLLDHNSSAIQDDNDENEIDDDDDDDDDRASLLSFDREPEPPLSSNRGGPSAHSSAAHLGASAMPLQHDPLPEPGFIHDLDDDSEINTNPSEVIGGFGTGLKPAQHPGARDWAYGRPDANASPVEPLRSRLNAQNHEHSPRSMSHDADPQTRDEGYMSAANPMGSPRDVSPIHGMTGGIDDMISDGDAYSQYRGQGGNLASGSSHGMPSPIYDGASGTGIERIQSKDIVALMEHLTVRDAQRNARDTEILVTLVRSAAEMRNSFEDMKKTLEEQQKTTVSTIVSEVEVNTERSVQKVIQGPRPQPVSAPRRPRYIGSEEDADVEKDKRRSVFKRALKGLSNRSSNDLQRIEGMLMTLLDDVEDLKGGQQIFSQYSQSLMQSQDALKSPQEQHATDAGPSNQAFVPPQAVKPAEPPRITTQISPIQEDESQTPKADREAFPLDSPTVPKAPLMNSGFSNTPTKSEKQGKRESGSSSIFPKISRWSETTASTTIRNILKGKGGAAGQDESEGSRSQSDFNFWEAEAKNAQQEQLHGSPFGQQHPDRAVSPEEQEPPKTAESDAPINRSNRISLDLCHPQPKLPYNHRLEAEAQRLASGDGDINLHYAANNGSLSSLGTYPPLGPGGVQNGTYQSPLAREAFEQHQVQTGAAPPRPPKITEEPVLSEPDSPRRKEKKHRERDENGNVIRRPKKQRSEEEKARRREKKERRERERMENGGTPTERKKSRDMLSPIEGSTGTAQRNPSTASRLNGPRPLSSNSNKDQRRRSQRHSSSNDTFGNADLPTYDYGDYN